MVKSIGEMFTHDIFFEVNISDMYQFMSVFYSGLVRRIYIVDVVATVTIVGILWYLKCMSVVFTSVTWK